MNVMNSLHQLTADIRDAGIRATMDPRDVNVPCALVTLDKLGDDNTMCGDYSATALVMLIASDSAHPAAMETLLDMYDKVSHLTTGAQASTFTWSDMGTLPALQLNPIELE